MRHLKHLLRKAGRISARRWRLRHRVHRVPQRRLLGVEERLQLEAHGVVVGDGRRVWARVSMCKCRVQTTAAIDTHVCSGRWTNCPSHGLQTDV